MAGWWLNKVVLGILESQRKDVSVPKGMPKRWSNLLGKVSTDFARKHQGVWPRL